jgi:hypothetical protein
MEMRRPKMPKKMRLITERPTCWAKGAKFSEGELWPRRTRTL